MKSRWYKDLKGELQTAGASTAEVEELLPLVTDLGLLRSEQVFRSTGAQTIWARWRNILRPALLVLSGAALSLMLVVWSQAASPTSWLYPVQKASDSLAISTHPQYRATVMMKRAQQVNQLVAQHADTHTIMATLADYSNEASAYKAAPHVSYAAFEYCETNLSQAAASASPPVRQAILSSLQSLQSI